jgi:hypothetical protein
MVGGGGGRPKPNEHFICLELQKLHKERERLQHEQDAITCREMMLTELARQTAVMPPSSSCSEAGGSGGSMKCGNVVQQHAPEGALAMMHAMQSLYGGVLGLSTSGSSTGGGGGGSGIESFGSQCSAGNAVVESHARQNSTDSGLGGMGTAYSLPRSPDDYLSNVDEMDLQEESSALSKPINCSSCYAMGNNCEVTNQMNIAGEIMDNEQIVSSLAGDISSELLSDMDVQKIDSLLWL